MHEMQEIYERWHQAVTTFPAENEALLIGGTRVMTGEWLRRWPQGEGRLHTGDWAD